MSLVRKRPENRNWFEGYDRHPQFERVPRIVDPETGYLCCVGEKVFVRLDPKRRRDPGDTTIGTIEAIGRNALEPEGTGNSKPFVAFIIRVDSTPPARLIRKHEQISSCG